MPNLAHGIDLVDIARIDDMLKRHPERFVDRCFTAGEREYADASPKRRVEHLAARFAAKEAALKALGTGWRSGIAWTDVEVVLLPSGQPTLRLSGEAARLAERRGLTEWRVSLTHAGGFAAASVIATGAGRDESIRRAD